jgi:hypothetical protein
MKDVTWSECGRKRKSAIQKPRSFVKTKTKLPTSPTTQFLEGTKDCQRHAEAQSAIQLSIREDQRHVPADMNYM